jgi:hypothetical protein
MLAEKINKPATKTTVQPKAVIGVKSLQSAPSNAPYQFKAEEKDPLQLASYDNEERIKQKTFDKNLVAQLQIIANEDTSPSLKHEGALDGLNAIDSKRDQMRQDMMNKAYLEEKYAAPKSGLQTRPRSKAIVGGLEEPLEGDGLFSISEGKTHTINTKASKVLTGGISSEQFHKENPAYGILGEGTGPAHISTSKPGMEDGKSIGRLDKWFMQQPKDGAMKLAFHITTSEFGAKGAATRIDGAFHNVNGRFGGGFHVASDKPTGAMEVDHHKNDIKKNAAKDIKDGGGTQEEQEKAYQEARELSPTNYLTYDVSLSGGDIVDATGALTPMVMNKPKEIERAAREDNKDGILYKSSRGSGLALVMYKNYRSVLALFNKPKAMTTPDKFSNGDKAIRDAMKTATPSESDIGEDRNPTTKISNKLAK